MMSCRFHRFFLYITACLISMVCLLGSPTNAQTQKTEHTLQLDRTDSSTSAIPTSIELEKLDWLVGRWVGTGLGGECEEVFLPPWNGSMTGTFRFASEGKLIFSEFFSITQSEQGIVLKLKHFHPDIKSWEEKDETTNFEFIRLGTNAIWFDGLTYQLQDQNTLNVWVAMKNSKTGELSEVAFEFQRAPKQQISKNANETPSQPNDKPINARIISKEIVVDCPKEKAFRMWTTSEGVATFFSPDSLIEPIPGGSYEMYFGLEPDENGRRGSQGSKVISIFPNEMLLFDWTFPPTTPELRRSGAKTHVKLEFSDVDAHTCKVVLKQYGWRDGAEWDDGFAYFEQVWPVVLTQFQAACRKKP